MKIMGAFLLVLLNGCSSHQEAIDDFNETNCQKYEQDLFTKYSEYKSHNTLGKGDDFISYYTAFCKIKTCKRDVDYKVLQSFQIYTVKDSITQGTLTYDLLHFNKATTIDTLIKEIRLKNCIDEQTMKLHRIYRVGTNTILCASFFSFNIIEFENFLMSEFNQSVNIELINISR